MEVVTPDHFTQGPVTESPYIFRHAIRYRRISFQATSITKVEVSLESGTPEWVDITANTGLLNVTTAGLVVVLAGAFAMFRVTYTGSLRINAN